MRPSLALTVAFVFASVLTTAAQAPPGSSGKIIFYREYHFGDSNFIPPLFCDGVQLARILGGSYLEVTATPGRHNCSAEADQRQAIPIETTPDGTVYVLVKIANKLKRFGFLSLVTEADYKQQTKLKPLASPIRLNGTQQLESAPITSAGRPSHTGRFGDLVVTATTVEERAGRTSDQTEVTVFVSVSNGSANTICSSLSAHLESTAAAEFEGDSKRAPRLSGLGPGDAAAGSYDFTIKNDGKPSALLVELAKSPANCGASSRPIVPGIFVPSTITLDLIDLPGSTLTGFPPAGSTNTGLPAENAPSMARPASFPRCVYCPSPHAPKELRAGKQGVVVLKVVIGTDGLPGNIEVATGSGYPDMDQEAIRTVKTWRFAPALDSSGKPLTTITPVEINFRLQR